MNKEIQSEKNLYDLKNDLKLDEFNSVALDAFLKWDQYDFSKSKTHFLDNSLEMISYSFCIFALVVEIYFLSNYQNINLQEIIIVSIFLAACVFWMLMLLRKQKQMQKSEKVRHTVINTAVRSIHQNVNHIDLLRLKIKNYEKQIDEISLMAKVGEMSYSLIHDMASPLSMMALGSSMLNKKIPVYLGGQPPAEIQKAIETIDKATLKLNRIQNIFRKAIKNKGQQQKIETDVVQLVGDMFSLFNIAFNEYQVESEFETPFSDLKCEIYEGILERILINLIQNALNALQTVSVRKLKLTLDNFDEKFYIITLQDSGPGIAKDVLDSGISRFGVSHYNTGNTKGSGFGLYSIKKMVEEMQGALEIRSNDQGTVFRMKFPIQLK